jgi:hypothetical protein
VVRRLRVFSTHVGTSADSEEVLQNADIECLASTMFRKLLVAAIDGGPRESGELARDWLVEALRSVYRSAEGEERRRREGEDEPRKGGKKKKLADLSSRLLNRGASDLTDRYAARNRNHPRLILLLTLIALRSPRDILLAQGHPTLSALPLLVYSLVNSDPLRPAGGAFQPSAASRLAAALHLCSMDPPSLVKVLAPRLELWESAFADGPAVERVGLSNRATLEAIAGVDGEAVLLMDSPRGTVVYFANTMGSSDVTELGEPLRKEIAAANREYSLEPGLFCVRAGGEGGGRLMDGLVEDASLGGGFDDWCDKVAEEVKVATN